MKGTERKGLFVCMRRVGEWAEGVGRERMGQGGWEPCVLCKCEEDG